MNDGLPVDFRFVQIDDDVPVDRVVRQRAGVGRGDRRLHVEWRHAITGHGAMEVPEPEGDERLIPAAAILFLERHQIAARINAGRKARRLQPHQRHQCVDAARPVASRPQCVRGGAPRHIDPVGRVPPLREPSTLRDQLLAIHPSPIVVLNRAVAVSRLHGAAAGLAALDPLINDPLLRHYHLLMSVRGQLLLGVGRRAEARAAFEAALGCSP